METGAISTASPARHWINLRLSMLKSEKSPPNGAFCRFAFRLYIQHFYNLSEKTSIVSGQGLKYSRFWEMRAGDLVRSTLRGG
jgi:hypothetical protein